MRFAVKVKNAWMGLIMALGMYSVLPVPGGSWNDALLPMVIPCLPLVGALIGALWYGLAYTLAKSQMSLMLQSALVLFTPFFLSGFLHTDGYMDTADAVFSRRDLQERRRILKDPHAGAFAIMAAVTLFLLQFCAVYTLLLEQRRLALLLLIPVLSRCVAGISVLCLAPIAETGYGALFHNAANTGQVILIGVLAALCFPAAWMIQDGSVLVPAVEVLAGALITGYLFKQFRGMSGDLCGFTITFCELAALLCMAMT